MDVIFKIWVKKQKKKTENKEQKRFGFFCFVLFSASEDLSLVTELCPRCPTEVQGRGGSRDGRRRGLHLGATGVPQITAHCRGLVAAGGKTCPAMQFRDRELRFFTGGGNVILR